MATLEKDKIHDEQIREDIGVAPIKELTENWLRWDGHVQRRPLETLVRRVDNMVRSPVKRGRGRLKRTWENIVKNDLIINYIPHNLVFDRAQWRNVLHIADFT